MRRCLRISASLEPGALPSGCSRWRAGSLASRPSSLRTCSHERLPPLAAAAGGAAEFLAGAPEAEDGLGITALGPLAQVLHIPRVGERDAGGIPGGPVVSFGTRSQDDRPLVLVEGEQEPRLACAPEVRPPFPEVAHGHSAFDVIGGELKARIALAQQLKPRVDCGHRRDWAGQRRPESRTILTYQVQ